MELPPPSSTSSGRSPTTGPIASGGIGPGTRTWAGTRCHDETGWSRATSRVLGLVGFPGQRRLTLGRLVEILDAQGLEPREAVLLPGLLPIGFVSAARP